MTDTIQAAVGQRFLQEAWNKKGFAGLSPIQQRAIPLILDGRDIIAESPTGTGKTLAYLLPLLDRIHIDKKDLQALVLVPTRELAMQILQEIQTYTEGSGIVSAAFIGGADIKRQLEKLKKHPQIVVGTPGRILELVKAKKMKMHEAKSIVIDEADQILQMGLLDNVNEIIKTTLRDRQLLFFSATMPEKIITEGKQIMQSPEIIKISKAEIPAAKVEHIYFVCERRDKIDLLRRIMKMDRLKAIAFVNGTGSFDELSAKLEYKGVPLKILHGEVNKQEREAIVRNFRETRFPSLLATDVAARGLDFPDVTHVIHFDLPETADQYVHRSGRTGRMGAAGTIISIIAPHEEKLLAKFSREIGVPIVKKELFAGEIVDRKPPRSKSKPSKPKDKTGKKTVKKSVKKRK